MLGISFQFSMFNMKVFYVFSLESPHRGDANKYKLYTIFIIKKKITLICPNFVSFGFFPRDSRTSSKQPWHTSASYLATVGQL